MIAVQALGIKSLRMPESIEYSAHAEHFDAWLQVGQHLQLLCQTIVLSATDSSPESPRDFCRTLLSQMMVRSIYPNPLLKKT